MLVHDDDEHVVQSTKAESGVDLVDMVAFLGLLIDKSNQRVLWAFQQTSSSHFCIPTPMWHVLFHASIFGVTLVSSNVGPVCLAV